MNSFLFNLINIPEVLGLGGCARDIQVEDFIKVGRVVPIVPEMRPLRVGLGYGDTPFPDWGHSIIDLQEGYSIPTTVLFVAEGHPSELQRAQRAPIYVLVYYG